MLHSSARQAAMTVVCFALAVSAFVDLTSPSGRKPAPDFTLNDSNGTAVHLSTLKGKVVLLDFWATWCHGCKQEIPWYVDFQSKYKESGLAAVGVAMDDDGWKSIKPFLAENKINYPIVVGDWKGMTKMFGFDALPVTLLIDRQGRIAEFHQGMVDKNAFEKEIQLLLAEDRNR
jgi:peroxiredoxin